MSAGTPLRTRRTPPAVRATATETRRSTAPVLALAVAATATALLLVHPDAWVGRWTGLATYLRTSLILVVPLVASVAAWQGGRERRRGLTDLLGTTPRPGWQALVATWAALVLATATGLVVAFAVGAAFVAPWATYAGGGWPAIALGCLPAVAAAAALGLLVGRWVPWRVAGLVLAAALYVALALPGYSDGAGWVWLDPLLDGSFTTSRLLPWTTALQSLWLAGLTVVLLALAALASRPVAARLPSAAAGIGAVLALAGAVPLGTGPADRWTDDPAALRPACTTTAPQVCVDTVDAFLLDDLAPRVQAALHRLAAVPGGPTRAVSGSRLTVPPDDALVLSDVRPGLDGGLLGSTRAWADPVESAVEANLRAQPCPATPDDTSDTWVTRFALERLAASWVLDDEALLVDVEPRFAARWRALEPQGRRAVVEQVQASRGACTPDSLAPALAALGTP